ncbi:hypothetical protein AB1Y20_011223 [Prymnesium parvum]|uniref:ABC transmembrane type-1 domain-containing protein n=1 Tax=Prymnesium parvum TaxID=97485 RepID=A0AB34IMR8_PRYPA
MAAFRPTLLVLGLTLGHTLPPPPSPNACRRLFPPLSSHRSPLRLLREHMQQHARVLSSAEAGEASDGRGAASAEASVASWGRLWRELRLTARLGFVLPASAISLLLGVAELVAPRIRGDLFDTVVRSGVSFAQLAPQLRLLGLLAIVGWAGSIVSSVSIARRLDCRSHRHALITTPQGHLHLASTHMTCHVTQVLFASARWASCMTGRLRLMQAVLAQEAAFFDRQPPGELASRLMSEPDRLEEIANRGIEKALPTRTFLRIGSLA